MERHNLDSPKERVLSIDSLGSGLALGSIIEARPVARPFRKVRAKSFAFFQTVNILRVIPDKAPAIAERPDELVGCCCRLDILNLLT
jgi:hypothetical protein